MGGGSGSISFPAGAPVPLSDSGLEPVSFATTQKPAVESSPVPGTPLAGPNKYSGTSASALPTPPVGVAEVFPAADLSAIPDAGPRGNSYMLDGGHLDNLELNARRIVQDGQPGIELQLRLNPAFLHQLEEKLKAEGALEQPVSFTPGKVDDAGRLCLDGDPVAITGYPGGNCPDDVDQNQDTWSLVFTGAQGERLQVTAMDAAHALRGYTRITLVGDDATCTQQLSGLTKQFGLKPLLAPPTEAVKQKALLCHLLWNVNPVLAEAVEASDLESLTSAQMVEMLQQAGYDAGRIENARWAEVFDQYCTVIDPGLADEMVEAGARYLYSTVDQKAHVLSILTGGQMSSLQRYKEGMIFNGMSTMIDFGTGGAAGVFSRVVTQKSILASTSWTGRKYKIILSSDLLARTDGYGWNGDKYGRAWGLSADENFGASLVERIDEPPQSSGYQTNNEMVWRTGNSPRFIQHVAATCAQDRADLIRYLRDNGYAPPNGQSLEQFVVLAPTFFQSGRVPYDLSNLPAFVQKARQKAQAGKDTELKWFLWHGPDTEGVRGQLMETLLLSSDPTEQERAFEAVRRSQRVGISPERMDQLIEAAPSIVQRLLMESPAAMLKLDLDELAGMLAQNHYALQIIDGAQWVDVLWALVDHQTEDALSASIKLVFRFGVEKLVNDAKDDFANFLATYPLFEADSSWIVEQVSQLDTSDQAVYRLSIFLLQAESEAEVADVALQLLQHDGEGARRLLALIRDRFGGLGIDPVVLATTAAALPADSPVRSWLVGAAAEQLLLTNAPQAVALLRANRSAIDWTTVNVQGVVDALWPESGQAVGEMLHFVLREQAFCWVSKQYDDKCSQLLQRLSELPLYPVPDLQAFVDQAVANENAMPASAAEKQAALAEGRLQLIWLLTDPKSVSRPWAEVFTRVVLAHEVPQDYYQDWVLQTAQWKQNQKGRLPIPRTALSKLFLAAAEAQPNLQTWLASVASKALLLGGNPEVIETLRQMSQKGSYFPSDDDVLAAIVRHHEHSSAKSNAALDILLQWKVKDWLCCCGHNGFQTLLDRHLTPETCGITEAQLLESFRNHFSGFSYNPSSATWAHIFDWMLTSADGSLNAWRLEALLADILEWPSGYGQQQAVRLVALDRLAEHLPSDWAFKVQTARKELTDIAYQNMPYGV